jgi:hypothetical protein
MRFRIRLTSVLLALLLCGASAAAASAAPFDDLFAKEYREHPQPWHLLVPPPPLDELPPYSYHSGIICTETSLSDARHRYCDLSRQCLLGASGTLKNWCDVLGEMINDRYSLKACQSLRDRDTQPQCVQNRRRLAAQCERVGPGREHLIYLCAGLRAVYPPGSSPPLPPAPEEPPPVPQEPPPAPEEPLPPVQPPPTQPTPQDPGDAGAGAGDTGGDLAGARSPWCDRPGRDAATQARCERSGSIARDYPLSSYGIDSFVEVGVTKPQNIVPAAIQSLLRVVWFTLLLAVNGVMLLQEWAFSIDLVSRSLDRLRVFLGHLNNDLLGESWLLLGVSVAAICGMWSGFVRRRTIETVTGLGATVLMICLALAIIANPEATVGKLSSIANESSVSALSIVTERVEDPTVAYPKASRELFNIMVLPGWCTLQFGSSAYCHARPGKICAKDDDGLIVDADLHCRQFGGTVAEAWLAHPSGSNERARLFRGLEATDRSRVIPQTEHGAITRPGLLLLLMFTTLGAIMILLYLAIKLIMAAVMTLALLLALPVMLIVPAFGEAGRRVMVGYAKAGGGAIFAKAVYALGTAGVFVIADLISRLQFGPVATQLLLGVFFWGVWLRRDTIFGFVLPGSALPSLSSMYYGMQSMNALRRGVTRAATFPFRGTWGGAKGAVRIGRATHGAVAARRNARREAVRQSAQDALQEHGRDAVRTQNADDMQRARGVLAAEPKHRQQLDASRDLLQTTDDRLGRARTARDALQARRDALSPQDPKRNQLDARLAKADAGISHLEAQRGSHQGSIRAAEAGLADVGWAQATVRRAPVGGEIPVRESDVRDHIAARQRLLARRHPTRDSHAEAWERTLHARSGNGRLSRRDRGVLKFEMRRNKPFARSIRQQSKRIRKGGSRSRPRVGRW